MKHWWSIGIGAAVVLAGVIALGLVTFHEDCRDFKQATLVLNGEPYRVALAHNDLERKRGLIGCTSIPHRSGMYFPYDTAQDVAFWMKGMSIPLDIIWVTDGRVVGIEEGVPPIDKLAVDPPHYRPPQPITGVLEIEAGKAREYGIQIGSTVQLQ